MQAVLLATNSFLCVPLPSCFFSLLIKAYSPLMLIFMLCDPISHTVFSQLLIFTMIVLKKTSCRPQNSQSGFQVVIALFSVFLLHSKLLNILFDKVLDVRM